MSPNAAALSTEKHACSYHWGRPASAGGGRGNGHLAVVYAKCQITVWFAGRNGSSALTRDIGPGRDGLDVSSDKFSLLRWRHLSAFNGGGGVTPVTPGMAPDRQRRAMDIWTPSKKMLLVRVPAGGKLVLAVTCRIVQRPVSWPRVVARRRRANQDTTLGCSEFTVLHGIKKRFPALFIRLPLSRQKKIPDFFWRNCRKYVEQFINPNSRMKNELQYE